MLNETASIQLTSIQGQLIHKGKLDLKQGNVQALAMFPTVEDGLYIISIRTSNGLFSKKISVVN